MGFGRSFCVPLIWSCCTSLRAVDNRTTHLVRDVLSFVFSPLVDVLARFDIQCTAGPQPRPALLIIWCVRRSSVSASFLSLSLIPAQPACSFWMPPDASTSSAASSPRPSAAGDIQPVARCVDRPISSVAVSKRRIDAGSGDVSVRVCAHPPAPGRGDGHPDQRRPRNLVTRQPGQRCRYRPMLLATWCTNCFRRRPRGSPHISFSRAKPETGRCTGYGSQASASASDPTALTPTPCSRFRRPASHPSVPTSGSPSRLILSVRTHKQCS